MKVGEDLAEVLLDKIGFVEFFVGFGIFMCENCGKDSSEGWRKNSNENEYEVIYVDEGSL